MAFNEALHARGTGAQGGQFVAKDGTKSSSLGYDGTRGSGYGSKGGDDNVKALQKALNKLGIKDAQGNPLKVDGKFGPRTTAALRRLQRKLGLPVDGKVTPALLKRIQGLKKKTTYTDAAPAKKAAPGKKTPPAAKRIAPEKPNVATKKAQPVRRFSSYSGGMTDLERHGTHNQKSHGNRLGRPENVGGKTGLAKATAALADKPEQGPARAPARRKLSAVDVENILKNDNEWYMGNSRRNSEHLKVLEDAGIGPDQAREILKDLGGNPDNDWQTTNIAQALHYRAEAERKDAAETERRNKLAAVTPQAYARLLGTDGKEALVKSKPVRAVFEAMQGAGWNLTNANGHGSYTFSSSDGSRSINVIAINGVTIYDERHNKISGVKALAYVKGNP